MTKRESKPLYSCDAAEALAIAGKNKFRRYPSPGRGGERLYPLATPSVTPGFQFGAEDTAFTIGSCFARNVEHALLSVGMPVLSRDFDLGKIGKSVGQAFNFFNKYTVHSILNELTWALERDSYPGEASIYQTKKGNFYSDAQLGLGKLNFPMKEILKFRHSYLDVMAQVATADVVIMTLGYVETWYDRELGIYLNIGPSPAVLQRYPNRFEFRVLSFEDVLDALNDIHALLLKHRKKPLKMLITVSPVPLLSTMRDMDVLVANAYSKSVQRAAVETFVQDKSGVDYFPSYEFVTLSNPNIAWSRGDYRHVNSDVVQRIMSNVLLNYAPEMAAKSDEVGRIGDQTATVDAVMASARMMQKLGSDAELIELIDQNPAIFDGDVDMQLVKAGVCERLGKSDQAIEALTEVIDLAPERPVPLQRLITATARAGDKGEARRFMKIHTDRFPHRKQVRAKLTKSLKL